MKKKIINGIMMVALVAATSTSFVSCKDTNEDARVESRAEYAALKGALGDLDSQLAALDSKYGGICDALDDKIDQTKTDLQNAINDLAGQIGTQEGRIDDLEGKLETEKGRIDALTQEVNELEVWLMETFVKLVTNVEISGTFSNVTGAVNFPGYEPKMLINCWGVAAEGADAWPYNQNLCSDDPWAWAAGDELGTSYENGGFAGYIYANINRYIDTPILSSVFHDNAIYRFDLVNTAGEVADGLVIDNVDQTGAPTTDVLQWGWTRADANNIYKFGVGYVGENASKFQPAKIDLKSIKEDIKKVWRSRKGTSDDKKKSLALLFSDLYYKVLTADTKMAKYALRVSWQDNTAAGKPANADETKKIAKPFFVDGDESEYTYTTDGGMDHIATTEAELVFATMKPYGFNSGEALSENVHSGVKSVNKLIEKFEPYIDKIINRVKKKLNLEQYHIDMTPFLNMCVNPETGKYAVMIQDGTKLELKDDNGDVSTYKVNKDIYIDVDDIVNTIEDACENLNKMLDNMQKLLNDIKGSKFTDWVEKYTNKFDNFIEKNADQMLQPVLLYQEANGDVKRVSGLSSTPSEVSGEVTLKPTTYTAELIAPCYAKFVAVKSVDGAAQSKADQEQYGKNFGHIIIAGDQELKFTPESGKLYQIVYEAVDFSGNQFKHNYYIQGK
jgi:uncharacterized protein YukE